MAHPVDASLTIKDPDLSRCDQGSAQVLAEAGASLVGSPNPQQLDATRSSLREVLSRAHKEMASTEARRSRGWRRVYTDACLLLAFTDILNFASSGDKALLYSAVSRLDHAIVIAGAPGEGRMDLVLDLIRQVQLGCLEFPLEFQRDNLPEPTARSQERGSLSTTLPSATKNVPHLDRPPSLSAFISRFSQQPFVLPGFLSDWPALNEHPWRSLDYLRKVAGPGRIVPVEVGSDYRSDDWTQQMVPWEEFLSNLERQHTGDTTRPVLYLAQHSLFNQFPTLRDDISVPDYVYTDLEPPSNYPQYKPPANEERLVLNAWLGPGGTVSPAHTVRGRVYHGCMTVTDSLMILGSFLQLLWYGIRPCMSAIDADIHLRRTSSRAKDDLAGTPRSFPSHVSLPFADLCNII